MIYNTARIYLKESSRQLLRMFWSTRFWSENKANSWGATPAGLRSSMFEPIRLTLAIKDNFQISIILKVLWIRAGFLITIRWCRVPRLLENTTAVCGNIKILTWRRISFSSRSCNFRKRQCWIRCRCQLCRHFGLISRRLKSSGSHWSTRSGKWKMKSGHVSKKKW